MLTQPINVAVVFDAQGRVHLQRGAEDLDHLAQKITNLSQRAGSSARVMAMLTNDLNRFGSVLRSNVNPALNFFNSQFERAHSLLGRMTRYGFYTLVAQFTAIGLSVRKLASDFIQVNQQFAQMEIVLKSVYGSARIARNLRDELARITIRSPLPFTDLGNIMRAYASIPSTSGQIARQAYQPGGYGAPKGFLNRGVGLVEKLLTFRPDKNSEDAVFSIREALAGELRSLVRRFEFPPQLLVSASGRSIADLKKNPMEMFDAMEKALSRIISPRAIQEMLRQPKTLFQNLVEQLKQIPLLQIGSKSGPGGVGLYDRILDYFMGVFESSGEFINKRFKPIADRIGNALHSMFETIFLNEDSIVEKIMDFAGLGRNDMPGLKVIDRIYEGIARLSEGAAQSLPVVFEKIRGGVETLLPILRGLATIFTTLAGHLKTLFDIHPAIGAAGIYGAMALPSLVRGGTGIASEMVIRRAQAARLQFNSNFVNRNTHLPNAQMMNHLLGTQGFRPVLNAQGFFNGVQPAAGGRFVGLASLPAPILAQLGLGPGATASQIRQAMNVIYGSAVAGPVPNRLMGGYSAVRTAASAAGAGGITSRLAGMVGGGALALGASTGLASNLAVGTMTVAGLVGSVLVPALIAIAATTAFTMAIDKTATYLRNRRGDAISEELRTSGITSSSLDNLRRAVNNEGSFFSEFLSTEHSGTKSLFRAGDLGLRGVMVPKFRMALTGRGDVGDPFFKGLVGESEQQMLGADLLRTMREKAMRDYEKLFLSLDKNSPEFEKFGYSLESDPAGNIVRHSGDAKSAIHTIRNFLNSSSVAMNAFIKVASTLSGVEYGDEYTAKENERLNQIKTSLTNFDKENVTGFIEQFVGIQKIADLINSFKNSSVSPQLTEETEAYLTKLRTEQTPFYALQQTFGTEMERITKFMEASTMMRDALDSGEFDWAGDSFNEMIESYKREVQDFIRQGKKPPTALLKTLKSLEGQGGNFSQQAFEHLNTLNQGFIDTVISESLSPAIATYARIFEDVGSMSDEALKRYADETVSTFRNLSDLALRSVNGDTGKANGALGAIIADSLTKLEQFPTSSGDLSELEKAQMILGRQKVLEAFIAPIIEAASGLEGMDGAKLILQRLRAQIAGAQGGVTTATQRKAMEDDQKFYNAITNLGVGGSGPASAALRNLRMSRVQGINKSDYMFFDLMQMDPTGKRGPEVTLAQAKAQEDMFLALGRQKEIYAQTAGLLEDQKTKALELAEAYYEQAAAANKVVESIQGQGGAIKSFTHGITSTLSQWRSEMKNFSEIGSQMATGFANTLSDGLTSIVLRSKDAKEAFRDFALSFIEMAVKMLMQKAVMMIFGSLLGPLSMAASAGLPATNASFGGAIAGVNGGYAKGGRIPGMPSDRDNQLAYVASGEYVIPAKIVQKYGTRFFDNLISGNFTSKVLAYSSGGYVGAQPSHFSGPGMMAPSAAVTVNVTVNNNGADSEVTTSTAREDADNLARTLTGLVRTELEKQTRQAGMFRKR